MPDVKLYVGHQGAEILVDRFDVTMDDGLTTAVYLSLFTDAESWWGDTAQDKPILQGSKLGTLKKNNSLNRGLISSYIRDALAWMVDGGMVEAIDVRLIEQGPNETHYQIELGEPEQARPAVYLYAVYWQAQRRALESA